MANQVFCTQILQVGKRNWHSSNFLFLEVWGSTEARVYLFSISKCFQLFKRFINILVLKEIKRIEKNVYIGPSSRIQSTFLYKYPLICLYLSAHPGGGRVSGRPRVGSAGGHYVVQSPCSYRCEYETGHDGDAEWWLVFLENRAIQAPTPIALSHLLTQGCILVFSELNV